MNYNTLLKSVSKPGRYTGGEFGQVIKNKNDIKCRFAFCFPDLYEIGMSNLGVRILYGALNRENDVWCERVYAPWHDMEMKMRENSIPLFALESGDPIKNFDVVAFTLPYELCYTNVINMLELGGIPLCSSERGDSDPIVLGGGLCSYNAEPIADFFDVFSIGEGEEALPEFARLYIEMKERGCSRAEFLREVSHLEGFYVPSLYNVSYNDGAASFERTISDVSPKYPDVPKKIRKRIVKDMDDAYFPEKLVMPYIETVHDRIVPEVFRGCIRGCRFCQAGMVCRPVRERSPEVINEQCKKLYDSTGYDELSLCSLSISDYSRLDELTDLLLEWTDEKKVSISLPSLRVDSFTKELMEKISTVRTAGLTFAPEAGTQRMRNVINKNVCEDDLIRACNTAFEAGKNQVKLYFMNGLPTETLEDIEGIAHLAKDVVEAFYQNPNVKRVRQVQVTISVACFIPKPFTPFQWEAQDSLEELERKQKHLCSVITDRKIKHNWHDAKVSRIEAVFARGDRRLSAALLEAHRRGIKFDSWDESFDYDAWMSVFEACDIDPSYYANREFGLDEILPWDIIDCGVEKEFLKREREKAYESRTTKNCAEGCSACGANRLDAKCRWCPDLQMKNTDKDVK